MQCHRFALVFALLFLISACASPQAAATLTDVQSTGAMQTVQAILNPTVPPTPTAALIMAPAVTATTVLTLTPAPGCIQSAGTVQQMSIDSVSLGEPLRFTLYLPPCYDNSRPESYPILYLLHGQNMDDTYWPSLGITALADQKIVFGAPAFIMVFPYEKHDLDPISESKYGEALMQDLAPYIESNFNVCTERACQAIGGISRGGGWAMHIGLVYFDKFGSIGAHSMGYFLSDLYRSENLLQTYLPTQFPRIYIDRGDLDDYSDSIDLFESTLTSLGIPHEYHVTPGTHNSDYWQSQVENYLDWYIQGFKSVR